NNQKLAVSLAHLKDRTVHYHLVDSMGETHDSLTLGTGKIDWANVLPHLNPAATSIYEINLHDQNNCREQIDSHNYLVKLYQKLNNRGV
ncbi:sugar phosphate isomerase/epimerase, partial [Lactobacillus reuteri]|nr:sugar phosphate isomerase/epimerase [Limosilactobacillus reuteri]